jgi:hypothetical protein
MMALGGCRKERILRGEEDGNLLHVYIQREHNETHQMGFVFF